MPFRLEPIGLWGALAAAVVSALLAVALAEVYSFLGAALGTGSPWLAAAMVHSGLSLVVVARYAWRRDLRALFGLPAWRWFAPALGILLGTLLLVAASRLVMGNPPPAVGSGAKLPWAWIIWVPVVEELVFRAGLIRLFTRLVPGVQWSAWFAALTFALVHASPTIGHLLAGRVGMPVGPFLLGLLAAALFSGSGRLAPSVALHAACNATVIVFTWGDPRWLEWLGFLYT